MKRYLPVILSVLVTIAVTFLLKDIVRQFIVKPLLILFWLIGGLPQSVPWYFFLGVVFFFAITSLSKWKISVSSNQEYEVGSPGQLEAAAAMVKRAHRGRYPKERLARHLGELTLEIIAHRERQPLTAVKKRLNSGELDLPPDIMAYIQSGLIWNWSDAVQKIKSGQGSKTPASPLDLDPVRVVEFLENQLEVRHDVQDR